jgi:DNA-directed RNA polymerase specialized sigma24 family protein
MNTMSKLQFQRLPPEAKRAALWRLAWTGLPVEQIADRTGCSVEQVRRTIDEESAPAAPSWLPA